MSWNEISEEIDNIIKIGTEVPKTDGGARPVTKIVGDRIYLRTGVETNTEKYTTKGILKYAYNTIESGNPFTSADLKSKFPREYNNGSCVFSMTGGILVLTGAAKYVSKAYILEDQN